MILEIEKSGRGKTRHSQEGKSLDKNSESFPSNLGSHVYKIAEQLIKDKQ